MTENKEARIFPDNADELPWEEKARMVRKFVEKNSTPEEIGAWKEKLKKMGRGGMAEEEKEDLTKSFFTSPIVKGVEEGK